MGHKRLKTCVTSWHITEILDNKRRVDMHRLAIDQLLEGEVHATNCTEGSLHYGNKGGGRLGINIKLIIISNKLLLVKEVILLVKEVTVMQSSLQRDLVSGKYVFQNLQVTSDW